jgi:hypothetical protein
VQTAPNMDSEQNTFRLDQARYMEKEPHHILIESESNNIANTNQLGGQNMLVQGQEPKTSNSHNTLQSLR